MSFSVRRPANIVVLAMLFLVIPFLGATAAVDRGVSHIFNAATATLPTIKSGQKAAQSVKVAAYGTMVAARSALPGDNVTPPAAGTVNSTMVSQFGISMLNSSAAWTADQAAAAYKVLASLPQGFRSCTKYIKRVGGNGGILGYVYLGDPTVHLCSSAVRPGTFQGTLVHEMVHCYQARNNNVLQAFRSKFWPGNRMSGRSVSSYGCTQSIEDMAECGRAYWAKGALMKRYYPARYEFMKQNVFSGQEFI